MYKEVFTCIPQGLEMHTKPWVRARASKEYWEKMKPAGDKRTHHNRFPGGGWGVTKRGGQGGGSLGHFIYYIS